MSVCADAPRIRSFLLSCRRRERRATLCLWLTAWAATLVCLVPSLAWAVPTATILRIDPRASQSQGDPVLTTVVEFVQSKRVSEATAACASARGNELYDCIAQSVERPHALYTPFPFPSKNAIFTVTVDGVDQPAKFVRMAKWGESQQKPGVGTAWLIMIDADRRMGAGFEDAKAVAKAFVSRMGASDIVDVQFFNDRQIVGDTQWLPAAKKATALGFIDQGTTYTNQGRNRALFSIVKSGATDGFKALGNVGQGAVQVPLHQALVVLSSGFGGADPLTTNAGALQLSQYMTKGRFPEDNTALPKLPVPIISIYFPHQTFDEYKQQSFEFMQGLANPEIGGFFSIMRAGQGNRAGGIVNAVRTRFSAMHIVEWRVSCIAPGVNQSFKLVFRNVNPPIFGDNTFQDVPVGIDPTTWPLDVDIDYTKQMAERQEGVYPGGTLKVYGNFCWGGDKERAEVYFLPSGQPLPKELTSTDAEKAKRTQQQLIAMGMKGSTLEVSSTYGEFEAPDKDKILHGSGKKAVVRLVLYDNKAQRISGVTANRIVELPGTEAPWPVLTILIAAFCAFVVLLLIVLVLRGGGRRRASPPPAPVMAAPGYPAPPGYPPAGGYPMAPAPMGPAPMGPGVVPMGQAPLPAAGGMPVPGGFAGAPQAMGAPPVLPPELDHTARPQGAGGPGGPQANAFMYGAQGTPPNVGVTNQVPAVAAVPPPDPYAPPPARAMRAVLQGAAGVFTVLPGVEMRVGRDGSQCGILLTEPRVSGLHATVKIDNGQFLLRDDGSNNGTVVNGNRLTAGVWTPVPSGSLVRFGPVEFNIRLE